MTGNDMTTLEAIWHSFGIPDKLAVLWFFIAWIGIGWRTEHPPKATPSVSVLMKAVRREWMRQFITRDTRIFDGNILANLRESTAFFASASMIAIGSGVALLGNSDRIAGIARQFDLENIPILQWEVKILLPLLLIVDSFLKFVWSNRLFGYCAIVMGSVPNDPTDPRTVPRAMQAADLNIRAARSYNSGLRGIYFAIGALAWLGGPLALAFATTVVLIVTWRREFASGSRRVLLDEAAREARIAPRDPQNDQPRD